MYGDDEIDWSDSSLPATSPPQQLLPEEEQRIQDEIDEIFEQYESAQPQDRVPSGWHPVQPEPPQPFLPQRRDSAASTKPPTIQSPDGVIQQPDPAVEQPDVVPTIEIEMDDTLPEETSSVPNHENVDHEMPDVPEDLEDGEIYEPPLLGRPRDQSPRYLDRHHRAFTQLRSYHRPVHQYPPEAMLERGTALATHTASSVLLLSGLGGSDTAVELLRVALQLMAAPLTPGPSGLLPTNKPISAFGAPRGSMRRVLLVRDKEREWSVSYGFVEFDSVEGARQALHRARLEQPLNRLDWPVGVNYADTSAFRAGPEGLTYDDEDTFVEELVLPTSGTLPQATGGAEPSRGEEEPAAEEEMEVDSGGFKAFAFPKRGRVPEEG